MKSFLVFLLFAFILCGQCNLLLAKSCKTLLGELGDGQMYFIYCATTKSVPVKICVGCDLEYHNLVGLYNNLMANENCSKLYLDSDRINIVPTTQGILTNLWEKANCDDCKRANNSYNYDHYSTIFDGCLARNKDDVCNACKVDYLNLNTFYKDMEKASKGQVCFDLQDNMNRTRLNWSKTLKCCQRESKLNNFLIAVAVVVLLPIVTFYVTAIVVTKRREANHGLLNEQEPELDAPSTTTIISAAVLSTRSAEPAEVSATTEKIANVLNQASAELSDDSSNDERPNLRQKQAAHPNLELDSSSSDEEPLRQKVLRKAAANPQSDSSSDDEPLVKPKRA
ncbi:osteopetrosis-associated transmembrane protein 1 [Drosophila kikkawai]|uniref:Osteopetrosis-associated transmembrane protein 1 n=1 Tax=Drosophila kikkawai TaxID=30033 RepID=A0A6P4IF05_DROKI|nr:osteopetrosis-associated transmembrane protein 1 [Drosophila kikkawai]XP_017021128.1 osteopetrosis-associated transmembrane protein 1 [Drosophila kikkawai]